MDRRAAIGLAASQTPSLLTALAAGRDNQAAPLNGS